MLGSVPGCRVEINQRSERPMELGEPAGTHRWKGLVPLSRASPLQAPVEKQIWGASCLFPVPSIVT